MVKVIYIVGVMFLFCIISCTKDNYIDTGISKSRFDGNMLEYMESHSYDWDSTVVMIRHAGADMVTLFEGREPGHEEITFLGITNHSIRRYLLMNGINSVRDLDPEWCRSILLQHVIDRKLYRKDIPEGKLGDFGTVGEGGVVVNTLAGTQVWMYVVLQEANGIKEHAARPIFLNFMRANKNFNIASGDIEPDNGLVHALEYKFTLGDEE